MSFVALVSLLLAASPDVAAPKLGPMSMVVNPALAREHLRSHGVEFDDVVRVRRSEANKVRAAVVPYLRSKIRESSEGDRPEFQAILLGLSLYRWHCAGHVYKNERRLFCVALSPAVDRTVLRSQKDAAHGLPLIFDGGIAILNVLFDFDRGAVKTFWWNGEA